LAEDRTVADVNDDVVELAEDAVVRIAHPVHLAESLSGWAEVFADYEILQPFPQLGRPVHVLTEDERTASELKRFQNVTVPVGKVLGLTGRGWQLDEPREGGVRYSVGLSTPSGTVMVELDPGIPVGDVMRSEQQTLTAVVLGGGPRTFGDLDPISASEVLADLTSLTS
jgi:hypothetical protein